MKYTTKPIVKFILLFLIFTLISIPGFPSTNHSTVSTFFVQIFLLVVAIIFIKIMPPTIISNAEGIKIKSKFFSWKEINAIENYNPYSYYRTSVFLDYLKINDIKVRMPRVLNHWEYLYEELATNTDFKYKSIGHGATMMMEMMGSLVLIMGSIIPIIALFQPATKNYYITELPAMIKTINYTQYSLGIQLSLIMITFFAITLYISHKKNNN